MQTKLRRLFGEWGGVFITGFGVAGIVILLRLAGLLQSLELWAFDLAFRLRPLEPPDPRIVIIGIDDADLDRFDQNIWAIPDGVLAQLLEKLKQQQPKAIGLDLFRNAPLCDGGYPALKKVFETTENLVGIEKKGGPLVIPPNPILKQRGQVASVDVVPDSDSKLRRGMLYFTPEDDLTPEREESVPSLGLQLALIYLEAKGITPEADENGNLKLGKAVFVPFEANDGGYVNADYTSYQILLNFRGPTARIQTVSLSYVLNNSIPLDLVRDRIVLIGSTARDKVKDVFETPYSGGLFANSLAMPGVEIQANLASQIVSAALDGRSLIQVWSEPLEWLWIFGWSSIGAILSWTSRCSWLKLNLGTWTAIGLLVASGILMSISYLAFIYGWWIPVVPPILALVGAASTITAYIATLEYQDRQTVMHLFGRHVSVEIAEEIWRERHQMLKAGRLLGRKMTATVLFTDLKDFSSITEQTDPEILMSWLNEYMEAMAQIVLAHGGAIDKFIGDSVMAVFGVPISRTTEQAIAFDARQAVSCALAMAVELRSLNQKWQLQGSLTAAMRIGIATGTVIAGSLGSSQRLDYTIIGDSVNVAARLESYDKSSASDLCRILISEETYRYIQDKFLTKVVGQVQLKGRQQPTNIYEVSIE